MLMIVPVLIAMTVALSVIAVAWRIQSHRIAGWLLCTASALTLAPLWLFFHTAWVFRHGFPIAVPDHESVRSRGLEALGRFWAEARYGLAGAVVQLALVAGCWRGRQSLSRQPS